MAPTKPRRIPRPRPDTGAGGCGPCDASRCQIHENLVTSNSVISPWDGRPRQIRKQLNCKDLNHVYYLKCTLCPMGPGLTPHYTGSSVNFRGSRWSKHKNDMIHGIGKDCHFCGLFITKIIWKIYPVLDKIEDSGPKEDDYPKLKKNLKKSIW